MLARTTRLNSFFNEASQLSTRQSNNSDDQVRRRDSPVPDCLRQTAHGARQSSGLRGGALVCRKQERKEDGVGGSKILNGGVDTKLLCALEDVEMRALENRAERHGPSTRSTSTEPMSIRTRVDACRYSCPKVRVRHDPGNPSEAERDERNATHLPFQSWCENSVAGKMRDLPHQQRSSDRDVLETQMDYFLTNRESDSELMTVLNFLDCDSGCTFACAVDTGPGDFLVSATRTGLEFCAGGVLGRVTHRSCWSTELASCSG